jgi:hypothetical protein
MVFLHKHIAEELAKHDNFFKVGKLYLQVFKDHLFNFLTSLTKAEFQKIWDVSLKDLKIAEDLLIIGKTVSAVVLAISCISVVINPQLFVRARVWANFRIFRGRGQARGPILKFFAGGRGGQISKFLLARGPARGLLRAQFFQHYCMYLYNNYIKE